MAKLIIVTVGTSMISNGIYDKQNHGAAISLLSDGHKPNNYESIVVKTSEKLTGAVERGLVGKNLSAEISSLIAFKGNNKKYGIQTDDKIVLFATDTMPGIFCAEVHKKTLDTLKWCKIEGPVTITGFNVIDAKKFKEAGLNKLKEEIDKYLDQSQWSSKFVNITGGYKGIIPFVTNYAFHKCMSLFYLYEEEGSELIIIEPPSIPPGPITPENITILFPDMMA